MSYKKDLRILVVLLSLVVFVISCAQFRTGKPDKQPAKTAVFNDPAAGDLASMKKNFATENVVGNIRYVEINDFSRGKGVKELFLEAAFFDKGAANPLFDKDAKAKVTYKSVGGSLAVYEKSASSTQDGATPEAPSTPQGVKYVRQGLADGGKTVFYLTKEENSANLPMIDFHDVGFNRVISADGADLPSFNYEFATPVNFTVKSDEIAKTGSMKITSGSAKDIEIEGVPEGAIVETIFEIRNDKNVATNVLIVRSLGKTSIPAEKVKELPAGMGLVSVSVINTANFKIEGETGGAVNIEIARKQVASLIVSEAAK